MYKWFLAWRYLHTKLIAVFAVLGVTLCVAMVLVVMSVMGGFLDTVRERSRGLLSDIVMDARTLQGWPYYEEFRAALAEKLPDVVEHSTPVVLNYGIFRVPESSYTMPARVVGIHLDDYAKVNDFHDGLHYERYWPGTTRLDAQEQPMAALNDSGGLVLPAEFEEANRRWRDETEAALKAARGRWRTASEAKRLAEEISRFDAQPFELYPSRKGAERLYAVDSEPGFAGPARYGAIVGCDLINERGPDGRFIRYYARGLDVAVTLMPLTERGTIGAEGAVKVPLRYVDDSRTGVYDVDKINVYVEFAMLQQKLAMDPQELADGTRSRPRTTQLLIGLKEGIALTEGRDRIRTAWAEFVESLEHTTDEEDRLLHYVDILTWEDLQRDFINAVEKEKVLVTALFGVISLVAIVLIGCIFYMIVQKKTKDVGILKALGARGEGVAALFIIYAACVGVVGSMLGTAIGATFVWFINDIQAGLVSLNPELRVWDPAVYTFDQIPNVVKIVDVLWICGVAILASVVGSLIPAYIAGRIWPVEALRYE